MKLSAIITTTALLLIFWSTSGYSGQRELQNLLIGAGSGAIIGHALGGDAESALIGSALGGIVGLTAGGVYAGSYHGQGKKYHRNYHHRGHRDYRDGYQKHYKPYRPSSKHYQNCRVIKKRIFKHGQSYFITKRICNDRNHYHKNRHYKHDGHNNYFGRF